MKVSINKILLITYLTTNTHITVFVSYFILYIFTQSIGLPFFENTYCMGIDNENNVVNPYPTDLPIHDDAFYNQFKPSNNPVYNHNAFWGFGSPYNMQKPYDELHGYSTWDKNNTIMSDSSTLSRGSLTPSEISSGDLGNETAEFAEYNLHLTSEDLIQSLLQQVNEALIPMPLETLTETKIRTIIHECVKNDVNRHFWACDSMHKDMLFTIQQSLRNDCETPDMILLHNIGTSLLIDFDALFHLIDNEDAILQHSTLYQAYHKRVYDPNDFITLTESDDINEETPYL